MKKAAMNTGGIPGGSSLMVIFAVLCIFTFAILSLSGSLAGKRLADAQIEAVLGYYSADYEAETVLSELRKGCVPEGVENKDGMYRYSSYISDTSTIEVEVEVSGSSYGILKWQQVYTADWKADESLKVWNRN